MAKQTFKWTCAFSSVGLAICVVVFAVGEIIQPTHIRMIRFSNDCHLGILARGNLDTRVSLYSDSDLGPYQGSTMGLMDEDGNVSPVFDREQAIGDTFGVYHRYFREADTGTELSTTLISFWYPMIIFSIIPSAYILRKYLNRRCTNTTALQAAID